MNNRHALNKSNLDSFKHHVGIQEDMLSEEQRFKGRRSPFSVYDPKLYNLSPKQENLLADIEYKDFK